MAWETIQQNHTIIQQENTKSLLAPPSLAYNSPLLSTPSFSSSVSTLSSIQSSTHAPPHSELFHATIVQKQALKLEELRQDLTVLNKKYVDQIERLQEAEQQRAQVEHELENLSRQLFEQANAMVSKEKKKRYSVEQKLMNATRELKLAREELDNERAQLKELREKLESQTEKEKSETTVFIDFHFSSYASQWTYNLVCVPGSLSQLQNDYLIRLIINRALLNMSHKKNSLQHDLRSSIDFVRI
ncbi:hypothetical protein RO3G_12892 [Rhizopus delemar RA 99-880]|uniref:GDP/GTP exchange factor Sec2 N-terminal domain-containing protein n=1 Tax=Rhizopus delemar (strain RA 99-880 / ATCC MYA-4621 / FGSC 9543 / NRRL 43880) TaxID=246409 RepID=I1CIA1_RHIO9|nr:hypothetical protein RO3G_12892 [Rhizopus delemar RA 99-880]|eukprot:EIE88181.1 hypothetical protein RO3G_12892 [Rhizopus delemar RA 99-880]